MMMGGSTNIGIGRTTRVKAVSMIAWGYEREHCAHASFQILHRLGFNFPSQTGKSDGCWVTGAEQEMINSPIISHHHIRNSRKKETASASITYSARSHNDCAEHTKIKRSHVWQRFLRIPPHSRCRRAHRYLQTAQCVSSGPRYRCLHSLKRQKKTSFNIFDQDTNTGWQIRNIVCQ